MKRTVKAETVDSARDEMQAEYRFDYRKSRPNRFATRASDARIAVTLDADVAVVFTSAKAVNRALRAMIEVVPAHR
ncbi:MAG: hypothetical protein A3K19_02945 [Lentisphaerae bacterium RIFOXYB12_FULL_65_16]|nr:MAG: hypothetical protein A3K18_19995 [Lentisphaerae bacterium RIFOXYA12_64_32]OGV92309.1 MAG: hypothetical protein A3K19_02945 [Lentisphaerae bacterium RIFOXYB12_FULL_65_16]